MGWRDIAMRGCWNTSQGSSWKTLISYNNSENINICYPEMEN